MIGPLFRITRPFTLLPPVLGMLSGAAAALAVQTMDSGRSLSAGLEAHGGDIVVGALMAGLLNAASNVLNQVTEMELDRINKPHRVMPRGELTVRVATVWSCILYVVALGLAWTIEPEPGVHHAFWCALAAAVATVLYTVKPVYAKSRGWWANLTIAVPRGMLLKVAGWATVASAAHPEPWFIGLVFALFLVGAASTKDFADVEGDRAHGIGTLPVRFGAETTARIIGPFFVAPWLLLPLGVWLPGPHGGPWVQAAAWPICALTAALVVLGASMLPLMRQPGALATDANHPIWARMYALMMVSQVGLAVCYLLSPALA